MEDIFINIDSKFRDMQIYPKETKFRYETEINYKNIIMLFIYPFTLYRVRNSK